VAAILLSGALSMVIAMLGTRAAIAVLRKRKLGQQVRSDGPPAHLSKSGTPTMGGIVIIVASLIGYVAGHLFTGDGITASGVLVLFLMTGLGLVGFVDDFIKLFMRRSSTDPLTQGLPPIWLVRSSKARPCCIHHAEI
jgi:phospho-N-acetylmuramoyl-pentapeptide-transferase